MASKNLLPQGQKDNVWALRDIVKDASKLASKRKELDKLRMDHNRDWAQNRSFYNNHQWIFWNGASGRVESLGVEDGEKPRYKVRLTNNQVTPGVTQLVAQMTKTRPTIHAVPSSSSGRDVQAAELAERLYEFWWDEFHLKHKLQQALTHAQISQGYWLITWDPYAGSEFRVMVNPTTGEPVTDDELADLYREQLMEVAKERGIDPAMVLGYFEKTLYIGDINVRVLSGEQVWVDPVATAFEDANYVICRYPMDVDEIEARWGVKVAPDTTTAEPRPQLIWSRQRDTRAKTAREVYCIYARPTAALPKGKVVYWIEDPNEILEASDWRFPFNELPVVKYPGIQGLDGVYDQARVSLARPLQKELNNKISKIAEHMNLTMRPQMIAPFGSVTQQLTDEPGLLIEYAPVQNQIPQWRPIPTIPQQSFEYVQLIQGQLDRIFNLIPGERSQLPARTDSGELLELMQEAVSDQIAPEIQRMELSLARAGRIMAMLAQKFYIEPRFLKIRGPGGSVQTKKFLGSDLAGGFNYEPESGSGLPRTRAGQIAQIKELVGMGAITIQDAIPYLPIGGLKAIQSKLMADEDYAYRKIDKLIEGQPLNIPQLQEAAAMVQSGVNPQTGMPFANDMEIAKYLQDAALAPVQFENWQKSMEVLREHMLTPEFENYPEDVQARFLSHYDQLWQTVIAMPQATEPVKTNLSLRATVGPTVAGQILRNHGIFDANPQTMSELPLDTDVRDYLGQGDRGTGEGSGNHPLSTATQMQEMAHSADKHVQAMARSEHEHALAQARNLDAQTQVAMKLHAHNEEQRRKEEVHRHRLDSARRETAARMAQRAAAQGG